MSEKYAYKKLPASELQLKNYRRAEKRTAT